MNFYRLRFVALAFLATISVSSVAACSTEMTNSVAAEIFDAEVVTSSESTTVAGDKGTLQEQIVEALNAACPDLSSFAGDPNSWVVISDESAGAPYRMTLDGGDGGFVVLWFTPGDIANLTIDEEYFDETNAVLYYSGCQELANEPDLDVEVGSTTETVEVEVLQVPDFVGAIQLSADRWFGLNASQVKVGHRFKYGMNPKTSCMVTGEGQIIDQSPRAGSTIENSRSQTIVLSVDCEW